MQQFRKQKRIARKNGGWQTRAVTWLCGLAILMVMSKYGNVARAEPEVTIAANGRALMEVEAGDHTVEEGACKTGHSEGKLFPEIYSDEELANGAVIIHVFISLYMFIGLAVICDEYFEPSLTAICDVSSCSILCCFVMCLCGAVVFGVYTSTGNNENGNLLSH